jgi:hypothetical protein
MKQQNFTLLRMWKWATAVVLLMLVFGGGAMLSTLGQNEGALADSPLVVTEQLDGWSYIAVEEQEGEDKVISMDILLPQDVIEQDLLHFVKVNQTLLQELIASGKTEIPVAVTFNHPLRSDEFEDIISRAGMAVVLYQFRALQDDGTRWTIGGAPEDGQLLAQDSLDAMMENIHSGGERKVKLLGVFYAEGVVTADAAVKLLDDERVFAVDVTGAVAPERMRIRAEEEFGYDFEKKQPKIVIQPAGLYWAMEDMGLVPIKQVGE